jgi:hypothetical protein
MLRRIVGSTIGVIRRAFYSIYEWMDGHVDGAPIMRKRINKGSDRYLASEKERLLRGHAGLNAFDPDSD